jgi:preprotein translocase subunit SecB
VTRRATTPRIQEGVRFARVLTKSVEFAEFNTHVVPSASVETTNVALEMNVSIGRAVQGDNMVAEVTLGVVMTPDPGRQPYRVSIVMAGLFVAPEDANDEAFDEFCKRAAPVIIWPYVRALASTITTDGRYGPLRLDPVNLTAFLTKQWSVPSESATVLKKSRRKHARRR